MNNAMYEKVMNKINSSTIEDLEKSLREFGFEVERKVTCWESKDILKFLDSEPYIEEILNSFKAESEKFNQSSNAANDNSYALAA